MKQTICIRRPSAELERAATNDLARRILELWPQLSDGQRAAAFAALNRRRGHFAKLCKHE